MHAVKVLEEVGYRMRNGEVPILSDVLLELENKLHDTFTEDDRMYSLLAELQSLGYAARQLYQEANGDSIFHMPNWPNNSLKEWRNECLLPFLEALSYRLRELSKEFHVLLFQEWVLEPHVPHEPTAQEIAKERQLNFMVSKSMLESISKRYPDIEGELNAVLDKVKPEELESAEAKVQPEA